MVKCMCSWKQTLEVWPALLVVGRLVRRLPIHLRHHAQLLCRASMLYPMTDIGGGIFSLVVTAVFLQFWKPTRRMALRQADDAGRARLSAPISSDGHAAKPRRRGRRRRRLSTTPSRLTPATSPWPGCRSSSCRCCCCCTGSCGRRKTAGAEPRAGADRRVPAWQTNYWIPVPTLDGQTHASQGCRRPGTRDRARDGAVSISPG